MDSLSSGGFQQWHVFMDGGKNPQNCQNIIRNVSKRSCFKNLLPQSLSVVAVCSCSWQFCFLLYSQSFGWQVMVQHVGETPSGAEHSDKQTEGRLCHQRGSGRCMGLRTAVLSLIIHSSIIHLCLWSLQSQPDERASVELLCSTFHSFSGDYGTAFTYMGHRYSAVRMVFQDEALFLLILDFCHIFDSASSKTKINGINGFTSRGYYSSYSLRYIATGEHI